MKTFTLAVYAVLGTLAVAAGAVVLVMPAIALPADLSNGLTNHLVRETAAAFVFIGLMFVWCIQHFGQRRPVHLAVLVFFVLFAGVHWVDYLDDRRELLSPIVNTIPALLLAATAPLARR